MTDPSKPAKIMHLRISARDDRTMAEFEEAVRATLSAMVPSVKNCTVLNTEYIVDGQQVRTQQWEDPEGYKAATAEPKAKSAPKRKLTPPQPSARTVVESDDEKERREHLEREANKPVVGDEAKRLLTGKDN